MTKSALIVDAANRVVPRTALDVIPLPLVGRG